MAFNKFDPEAPRVEPRAHDATSDAGARRVAILQWATWITWAMTALGFGLIAYWSFR